MDNQQPSINNKIFYQKPKSGFGFIYRYISPSGKSYIGQTVKKLKDRAGTLLTGNGYKKCTLFWKAIQKYGWLNFKVEILEEVKIEELNSKEIYYISIFNSLAPNGYNLTTGGECGKTREVYVYSAQNGEFLEHYSSLSEASLCTDVPMETISTILNKKSPRKQAHNFVFLDYYIPVYDINNLSRKNYHKVYIYNRFGEYLFTCESIASAARELGISDGSIRKCLNGISKQASGYQFRNEKFDKISPIPKNNCFHISVFQIDPKTFEVINVFPTLTSAAAAVGLKTTDGIKKVLKRKRGTSGGYFWKINEGSTTKCLKNPLGQCETPFKKDEDIV